MYEIRPIPGIFMSKMSEVILEATTTDIYSGNEMANAVSEMLKYEFVIPNSAVSSNNAILSGNDVKKTDKTDDGSFYYKINFLSAVDAYEHFQKKIATLNDFLSGLGAAVELESGKSPLYGSGETADKYPLASKIPEGSKLFESFAKIIGAGIGTFSSDMVEEKTDSSGTTIHRIGDSDKRSTETVTNATMSYFKHLESALDNTIYLQTLGDAEYPSVKQICSAMVEFIFDTFIGIKKVTRTPSTVSFSSLFAPEASDDATPEIKANRDRLSQILYNAVIQGESGINNADKEVGGPDADIHGSYGNKWSIANAGTTDLREIPAAKENIDKIKTSKVYPKYAVDVIRLGNATIDKMEYNAPKIMDIFKHILSASGHEAVANNMKIVKDGFLDVTVDDFLDAVNDPKVRGNNACIKGKMFSKNNIDWKDITRDIKNAVPGNGSRAFYVVGESRKENSQGEQTSPDSVGQQRKEMVSGDVISNDGSIMLALRDGNELKIDVNSIEDSIPTFNDYVYDHVYCRKNSTTYFLCILHGISFVAPLGENDEVSTVLTPKTISAGLHKRVKGGSTDFAFSSFAEAKKSGIYKYCDAVSKGLIKGRIKSMSPQFSMEGNGKLIALIDKIKELKFSGNDDAAYELMSEAVKKISAFGPFAQEKYKGNTGMMEFSDIPVTDETEVTNTLRGIYDLDKTGKYTKEDVISILNAIKPGEWEISGWNFAKTKKAVTAEEKEDETPDGQGYDSDAGTNELAAVPSEDDVIKANAKESIGSEMSFLDATEDLMGKVTSSLNTSSSMEAVKHDLNLAINAIKVTDVTDQQMMNKLTSSIKNINADNPADWVETASDMIDNAHRAAEFIQGEDDTFSIDSIAAAVNFSAGNKQKNTLKAEIRNYINGNVEGKGIPDTKKINDLSDKCTDIIFALARIGDSNASAFGSLDVGVNGKIFNAVNLKTAYQNYAKKSGETIAIKDVSIKAACDFLAGGDGHAGTLSGIVSSLTGLKSIENAGIKRATSKPVVNYPYDEKTRTPADEAVADFCTYNLEDVDSASSLVSKMFAAFSNDAVETKLDRVYNNVPDAVLKTDAITGVSDVGKLTKEAVSLTEKYLSYANSKAGKYDEATAWINDVYSGVYTVESTFKATEVTGSESLLYMYNGEQIDLLRVKNMLLDLKYLAASYNELGIKLSANTTNVEKANAKGIENPYFDSIIEKFITLCDTPEQLSDPSSKRVIDDVFRNILSNPMSYLVNLNTMLITLFAYYKRIESRSNESIESPSYMTGSKSGMGNKRIAVRKSEYDSTVKSYIDTVNIADAVCNSRIYSETYAGQGDIKKLAAQYEAVYDKYLKGEPGISDESAAEAIEFLIMDVSTKVKNSIKNFSPSDVTDVLSANIRRFKNSAPNKENIKNTEKLAELFFNLKQIDGNTEQGTSRSKDFADAISESNRSNNSPAKSAISALTNYGELFELANKIKVSKKYKEELGSNPEKAVRDALDTYRHYKENHDVAKGVITNALETLILNSGHGLADSKSKSISGENNDYLKEMANYLKELSNVDRSAYKEFISSVDASEKDGIKPKDVSSAVSTVNERRPIAADLQTIVDKIYGNVNKGVIKYTVDNLDADISAMGVSDETGNNINDAAIDSSFYTIISMLKKAAMSKATVEVKNVCAALVGHIDHSNVSLYKKEILDYYVWRMNGFKSEFPPSRLSHLSANTTALGDLYNMIRSDLVRAHDSGNTRLTDKLAALLDETPAFADLNETERSEPVNKSSLAASRTAWSAKQKVMTAASEDAKNIKTIETAFSRMNKTTPHPNKATLYQYIMDMLNDTEAGRRLYNQIMKSYPDVVEEQIKKYK